MKTMRTRLNVLAVAALLAACSPALRAPSLQRLIRHLLKADIGAVEGTSPVVLVQFRRDGCQWCERFEREVVPEFRRLYVETRRVSFTQVDVGQKSPFGNEVSDVKKLGRVITEPMLLLGQRTEDGGLDIKIRYGGFMPLNALEQSFTNSGLPIPNRVAK